MFVKVGHGAFEGRGLLSDSVLEPRGEPLGGLDLCFPGKTRPEPNHLCLSFSQTRHSWGHRDPDQLCDFRQVACFVSVVSSALR